MFDRVKLNKIVRLGLVLGVFAFSCLLVNQPAMAAKSEIAVSPAKTRLELRAGQVTKDSFTVLNTGDEDFSFTVRAVPYQVNSKAYNPVFTTETKRTQLNRWIKFEQTNYHLPKGQKLVVSYRVTTPASIPDGDQYAAIFVTTDASQGASVQSQSQIALLVYAKTDGQTINKGQIVSPQIQKLYLNNKLTFTQDVENTGNTDFEANLKTKIETIFGKTIFEHRSENITVMAETTRSIVVDWPSAPLFGVFKVSLDVSIPVIKSEQHFTKTIIIVSPIVILIIALLVTSLVVSLVLTKRRRTNFGRR